MEKIINLSRINGRVNVIDFSLNVEKSLFYKTSTSCNFGDIDIILKNKNIESSIEDYKNCFICVDNKTQDDFYNDLIRGKIVVLRGLCFTPITIKKLAINDLKPSMVKYKKSYTYCSGMEKLEELEKESNVDNSGTSYYKHDDNFENEFYEIEKNEDDILSSNKRTLFLKEGNLFIIDKTNRGNFKVKFYPKK